MAEIQQGKKAKALASRSGIFREDPGAAGLD
jgi:hypothetical protein